MFFEDSLLSDPAAIQPPLPPSRGARRYPGGEEHKQIGRDKFPLFPLSRQHLSLLSPHPQMRAFIRSPPLNAEQKCLFRKQRGILFRRVVAEGRSRSPWANLFMPLRFLWPDDLALITTQKRPRLKAFLRPEPSAQVFTRRLTPKERPPPLDNPLLPSQFGGLEDPSLLLREPFSRPSEAAFRRT